LFTAGAVAGSNAPYTTSESVSADATKNYQADQYTWNVTYSAGLSSVALLIYQTDTAGTVDWGNYTKIVDPINGSVGSGVRNPVVYFNNVTGLAGATTNSQSVELFKGNYRAVIIATPSTGTTPIATYLGSVFSVAGTGLIASANAVTLAAPTISPAVTLLNTGGTAVAGISVAYYETSNKMYIGSATTDGTGTATIGAPTGTTGVIAAITTGTPTGGYIFNNLATSASVTLQQYTVTGSIKAPTGMSLDATQTPQVYAQIDSGLGRWNSVDYTDVATATATAGTGAYTLTLYGAKTGTSAIKYKIGVRTAGGNDGVLGYPGVSKTSVALSNAALTAQDINVAQGGVVMGYVHTEANAAVAATVSIYGTSADGVIDLVASASTGSPVAGVFTIEVPNGNYFMMVNGAVSEGVSASTGSLYYKDLTRFTLDGRVTKTSGAISSAAANATVRIGAYTAATNSLGAYSISAMEGKNWTCVMPNWTAAPTDITYSAACTLNVLVDAASVAAARH
jgi:hypothetical protein